MKRSFLFALCFAFFATLSFAQTEQGKVFIAGSSDLSFSSLKMGLEYDGEDMGDKVTQTQFSFAPSVGYFIVDNLVLSLNVQFESQKVEDSSSNSLLAGPGLRYYLGASKIKPFVQGDLMFGSTTSDSGDGDGDSKSTNSVSGYDLGAGVAVFFNQHVALDFGLGYAAATLTSDEDSKYKIKTGGVVFSAGISVYL